MLGLVGTGKAMWTAHKFRRSALGQALAEHTSAYFYSGQVLSWMKDTDKERLIADFYGKLAAIGQSPNGAMALRELLADYTIQFASLAVLCLTEEERAGHFCADNPYISGELHHHIREAATHNDETAQFVWKQPDATAEDLVSYCNGRSALMLYYANGLNMARIETGDHDASKDWFKPFVEAMMVWEEDTFRDKLGLPRLLPGPLHALPYSAFLNCVTNGERNPFFTWTRDFPALYLHGEGPRT